MKTTTPAPTQFTGETAFQIETIVNHALSASTPWLIRRVVGDILCLCEQRPDQSKLIQESILKSLKRSKRVATNGHKVIARWLKSPESDVNAIIGDEPYEGLKELLEGAVDSGMLVRPDDVEAGIWFDIEHYRGFDKYMQILNGEKWIADHTAYCTRDNFKKYLNYVESMAAMEKAAVELASKLHEKAWTLEKEVTVETIGTTDVSSETIDPEIRKVITKKLQFLSGNNPIGEKIMDDRAFETLLAYTFEMVKNGEVPKGIKPFSKLNISNEHIRYAYYLIHEKLHTTRKIRPYYIDFLHSVFRQFSCEKTTTRTKFSKKPGKNYKHDMELMQQEG